MAQNPSKENVINTTNKVGKSIDKLTAYTTTFNQETNKTGESFVTSYAKAASAVKFFEGKLSRLALTVGGTGLSLKSMISSGWQLNQEIRDWGNNLTTMSDATGNTSVALKTMTSSFGSSYKGLAGIQSAMKALNSTGLPVSSKNFKELTLYVTNLSHAAGISDDTIAQLMGNAMRGFNVTASGAAKMVRAVMESGKAFGLTSGQMEEMMKVVSELHDNMAALFKDGEASSVALARGLTKSMGVLEKMGVSGQITGTFLKDMVDPVNMEKNTALLRRLGITYKDQIDMMQSENGKQTFFDKLMLNLPKISTELESIKDPFVRFNLAKSLGLPMEIAQKMAGKTRGEIEAMMREYSEKTKADEEKQKAAQAESQKYEETLKFLKMKALLPFMQFAAKWVGTWLKILDNMSGKFQGFGFIVTKVLNQGMQLASPLVNWLKGVGNDSFAQALGKSAAGLIKGLVPLFGGMLKGLADGLRENLPDIMKSMGEYIPDIVSSFIKLIGVGVKMLFTDVLPGLLKGLVVGFGQMFKESPIFAMLLGGFAVKKIFNFGRDFMAGGKEGRLRNIDMNVARIANGKALNAMGNLANVIKNPKMILQNPLKLFGIGGAEGGGFFSKLIAPVSRFGGVFSSMTGVFTKVAPHLMKALPVVGQIAMVVGGTISAFRALSRSSESLFNQNKLNEDENAKLKEYKATGVKNLDTKSIAEMIDLEGRKNNQDKIQKEIDVLMAKKNLSGDELSKLRDLREKKEGKGGELTDMQQTEARMGKIAQAMTFGLIDAESFAKTMYRMDQKITGDLTKEQQKSMADLTKKAGGKETTVNGNVGGAFGRYGAYTTPFGQGAAKLAGAGGLGTKAAGETQKETLLNLDAISKMTDEDVIKLNALQHESKNMFTAFGENMVGWSDRMIGTSDVYYQKEITKKEEAEREILKREEKKVKSLLSIASGAEKDQLEIQLKAIQKRKKAIQGEFSMSDTLAASVTKMLGLSIDSSIKIRAYFNAIGDYIKFGFNKFIRAFKFLFEKLDIGISSLWTSILKNMPDKVKEWMGINPEEVKRREELEKNRKEAANAWWEGDFATAEQKYNYITKNLGMNMNDLAKDMKEAAYAKSTNWNDLVDGYKKAFTDEANKKARQDEEKERKKNASDKKMQDMVGGIGGNVAKIKDETVKPKTSNDALAAYINSLGIMDTSFITR